MADKAAVPSMALDKADEYLAARLVAGERRALAEAITLVESTRADHRLRAEAMLARLTPHTGGAMRLGISGAPGVGKSTFIERLGLMLVADDHRVGVLAVDPSSSVSGGSILGDKTRMAELGLAEGAFIRPTPSSGALGGVARRTRETILLCEAAGYDTVLVESVGVGQSETALAGMVDIFLLLLAPGAGDDLQGIKKGILELADLVIVNKADGELAALANRSAADYANALRLVRGMSPDAPVVLTASGLHGINLDRVWRSAVERRARMAEEGRLAAKRADQAVDWLWSEIHDVLIDRLRAEPATEHLMAEAEAAVRAGGALPPQRAAELVAAFLVKGTLVKR